MSVEILTKPVTKSKLEKAKYIVNTQTTTKYNIKTGNLKTQKTYEAWKLENGILYVNTGHKLDNANKVMRGWVNYSKLYPELDRMIIRINDFIHSSTKGVRKDTKKSGNFETWENIVKIYY